MSTQQEPLSPCRIRLSQGHYALVDPEDYQAHSRFRWSYHAEPDGRNGYAVRQKKVEGGYRTTYLHREIVPPPDGLTTVFVNGNGLDCRKSNLKVVTPDEA